MRLPKPRAPLGVASAVLVVVAVTGCSSASTGSGAAGACDSPGVTQGQVTLGFVYPDTGASSSALSSARAGLAARIGLANEEGGVHGRRIAYEWRDDAGSGSVAATATEELIDHEKVFGLVTASAALGDSMDRLTQQGVPVTGVAVEPSWAGRENMFSFVYSASPVVVGRYIRAARGTRVAIITGDQSEVSSGLTGEYAQGLKAAGISTVQAFPYVAGIGDPDQVAGKIADFGADALLGITAPDDFAKIVQATRIAGAHLAVSVVLTGYDRGLLSSIGPALAGVSMPVFFRPFEAGGLAIQRYKDAMSRYAPESTNTDQQFAMFTYINTDLFLRGLDLAGPCPIRDDFIKALRGVPNYDADGLIAPVDLRDYSGKPLSCYAFVQVNPTGTAFATARERVCADGSTS
ncbi:ABC transporter substrate-binding protein [Pseudofrankia sp. BMG5.36]|uniref:ABC transporter substrate-binding protein n=1 Tax=Pseudofrankia sp. BMG5.36 TaxID=1834512 RepID=UPI0008DB1949|nr:ABC transporter substrate-binding protein [Pseudofrankia sp. BMG5.36]OHV43847.1 amino acid-binding protein [Pseudofrankia sp. BMG5.36]